MRLLIVGLLLFIPFIATANDPELLTPLGEPSLGSALLSDLGKDIRRNVEAEVQLESQPLLDISDPLDGDLRHYLISVTFRDLGTSKILVEGQVAARVFNADQRVINTLRLEPQQARWSGILSLPAAGESMIKIGTKLADGKKRIYHFFHERQSAVTLPAEPASAE